MIPTNRNCRSISIAGIVTALRKAVTPAREFLLFWGIFFLLVGSGLTGSSLGWYQQDPVCREVIQLEGERRLAGKYRGIRGDEFIAHGTPNALAQVNASPRFPRFNPNLGLGGRDLLVLHDLGAPVKHLSMIGRPACWGFFLLDLRRALAWYWWLPVFLAMQFTRLFLRETFRVDRFMAWMLAAGIVFSPCSAGWSFWPANHLAGIMAGSWALLRFSRSRYDWSRFGWALLCGWGGACAALSLYFPRVFSIGFIAGGAVLAAILSDPERRKTFADLRSWGIGFAGLLPALLLLIHWKTGCAAALAAINASAYPGVRRMYGGDLALWELMRGWLAPLTICRSPLANQSESQAVLALYLPLAVWTFCMGKKLRRPALWYTVGGGMIFLLVYQLIGLPKFFADLTLWSRCNPFRCMMALSFGQFLMLAQICEQNKSKYALLPALTAGLAAAFLSFALLFTAPWELVKAFTVFYASKWIPAGALAVSFQVLLAAGTLLLYRPRAAAILFAGYSLILGAVFNPVCIAPKRVSSRLTDCIHQQTGLKYGGRVLFATGNDFAAVCHYSGGGRTLNGYFMYPDEAVQEKLFSALPEPQRFRRMNHLDAEISAESGAAYTAEIPYNDRILLHFGPAYDFSQLPVDFLAVPQQKKDLLLQNPSLLLIRDSGELALFRVRPVFQL